MGQTSNVFCLLTRLMSVSVPATPLSESREAYLLFLREAVLRLDREPTAAAASNNHGPIRSISSAAAAAAACSIKDPQKVSKKRIIHRGDKSCPHSHSRSIRCEVARKLDPVSGRRSLRGYSYPGAIPASTPEDPVLCCSCGL